jgi:hypothetical protein
VLTFIVNNNRLVIICYHLITTHEQRGILSMANLTQSMPSTPNVPLAKPQTHNGTLNALPAALLSMTLERRWIVWCWVWRKDKSAEGGKWTKPPFIPGNGQSIYVLRTARKLAPRQGHRPSDGLPPPRLVLYLYTGHAAKIMSDFKAAKREVGRLCPFSRPSPSEHKQPHPPSTDHAPYRRSCLQSRPAARARVATRSTR